MTVKVTKPALNLREKLSELDKPSGIAGQDILKADTPQEVFNYIGAGRRNLIINGAMQVAQRGTSFTDTGYTVDRWALSLSDGTATVTQEAFTLGQTEVSGNPKNYLKVACSVGNGNCGINQPIENYAAGAGGKVTLSFWAKGTNPASGYFDLQLWQRMANGTGFHETALTLNSDWTYHTFTFDLGSLSGFTATSSSHLDLIIRQPVGDSSTDAWELNITNVQLEVGSVATPFEHRSYGEELALCQRYYQVYKTEPYENYPLIGRKMGDGTAQFAFQLSKTMRASPSGSYTGDLAAFNMVRIDDGAGAVPTAISITASTHTTLALIKATTASYGTSNALTVYNTGTGNRQTYEFDAEL